MSFRIRKKKKVFTKSIGAGYLLVMRLFPLIRTQKGCVWLVSLAIAKSRRQINDWLSKRKNARCRRLDSFLTGKIGILSHGIAIKQLRQWMDELPEGHSISFRCESANPDKQFRIWKKWFERRENKGWEIEEDLKSFFYYKKRPV